MILSHASLLALLVHIQANLDSDLTLESLSQRVGLSAPHFQRVFKALVGESPKQYVLRLRLERAAFRLLVHDETVLEIALHGGFGSHETFTRAFHRRFGLTPNSYRAHTRTRLPGQGEGTLGDEATAEYSISATKVRRLRPAHLAFMRHVGPYEEVPESLFDTLSTWAAKRGLNDTPIWMGLGHDAPGTTAPEKLRFDAALVVDNRFESEPHIGYQFFPGGEFAVTTHAGPWTTLSLAYLAIFPRVISIPRYQLIGLPAVEFYRTTRVDTRSHLAVTEICLPVRAV